MSHKLISLNHDLKRLRDEGYAIEIRAGYVLLHDVPYVNAQKEIKYGILLSTLTLAGEQTRKPDTHIAHFVGEAPCNKIGQEITQIKHGVGRTQIAGSLVADRSFSNKPGSGYDDYYEKMNRYAVIISSPANSIDSSVTAKCFKVIESPEEDIVFNYMDTASSRSGTTALTAKFESKKIAIVGLGGTGAYILDQVAKTPVQEVHIFDSDEFQQHNAFRAPGAPSLDYLRRGFKKVEYFADIYSRMHKYILPHPYKIDVENVAELYEMDFVFVCVDDGDARKLVTDALIDKGITFIDCGMGVDLTDGHLGGILRITVGTDVKHDHTIGKLPFANDNLDDAYTQNIQIADLNALNAIMAVLKWKKLFGFYRDFEQEHHTTYTIDGNLILNDDASSNDDELTTETDDTDEVA